MPDAESLVTGLNWDESSSCSLGLPSRQTILPLLDVLCFLGVLLFVLFGLAFLTHFVAHGRSPLGAVW